MDYEQTIIIVVAFFSAFVLLLLYRRYELSVKTRMLRIEYQNRLLDKFGTATEFVDFLKSDQSKKVLEDPVGTGHANPMNRVLRGVQIGLVVIIVGVGLLVNAWMMGSPTDPNDLNKQKDYLFLARQCMMVGVAFFVVSGVSHVLAKRWGLMNPKNRLMNE
jgi:hypothetical protein